MDVFQKCFDFKRDLEVKAAGLYPFFKTIEGNFGSRVIIEGREVVMAGSNNYLGLTRHPKVVEAAVEATKKFIDDPKFAEKYVREQMFKGQITAEEYQDAIGNSPFSYDISVEHIQVTTDLMAKYGVGKMAAPPKATDWVKLDLLQQAKKELKVK